LVTESAILSNGAATSVENNDLNKFKEEVTGWGNEFLWLTIHRPAALAQSTWTRARSELPPRSVFDSPQVMEWEHSEINGMWVSVSGPITSCVLAHDLFSSRAGTDLTHWETACACSSWADWS